MAMTAAFAHRTANAFCAVLFFLIDIPCCSYNDSRKDSNDNNICHTKHLSLLVAAQYILGSQSLIGLANQIDHKYNNRSHDD